MTPSLSRILLSQSGLGPQAYIWHLHLQSGVEQTMADVTCGMVKWTCRFHGSMCTYLR